MRTTAVPCGDGFIINGAKNFITNGPEADVILFLAQTDPPKKHRGITAFVVEMDHPGIGRDPHENKMGIRASGTCTINFDDCYLGPEHILGYPGSGFKIAMVTLDGGRIGIAAQALGIANCALSESLKYSAEREAFDKPINQLQAIQFKLADMATKLEAARLLTYRAAWLKDQGQKFTKEAAMAKMYASEAAVWIANEGVQIHGGFGYLKEYAVERNYRDAKITTIYEGTNEIQRLVIANQLLR